MGNVQDAQSHGTPNSRPAPAIPTGGSVYPNIGNDGGDHDYEILKPPGYPIAPSRPAPRPPPNVPTQDSSNNLGSNTGTNLDGVPFIVNPKFLNSSQNDRVGKQIINIFLGVFGRCTIKRFMA